MNIGELDRRITIQEPRTVENTYGEWALNGYIDVRVVWAKVDWVGGSELDEVDKKTAITKVDFYIRNLDLADFLNGTNAPTMAHRIAFVSQNLVERFYYLESIEQIEGRKEFLKITTREKD